MRNMYCIVGRSASGKTTLANNIEKKYGIRKVRSYTTRPPRFEGEADYVFVTAEEFSALGPVFAYGKYAGNEYGVPPTELDACGLYIVDLDGAERLKEEYEHRKVVIFFIDAPKELCADRMSKRGDKPSDIEKRLRTDAEAFLDAYMIADNVFQVTENTALDELTREVYTEMCYHEVSTMNEMLQDEFPGEVVSVKLDISEGEMAYSWFDGETYSAVFATLEEVANNARLCLRYKNLKTLYRMEANSCEARYMLDICCRTIPAYWNYINTGDVTAMKQFMVDLGQIDFAKLSSGLNDLINNAPSWTELDALYEAYSHTVFLYRNANGLPILE